ncbi:MAG: mechanosensitive ion channel family protein [Parascardovia denticolens]
MHAFWPTLVAWIKTNSSKITYLAVTFIVAFFLIKWVTRIISGAFRKSNKTSASLFVNIIRVILWSLAVLIVLKPVFGITPSTLLTALGVGGVALSLGMQDTISNLIGGFMLMMGKVISPGDTIKINDSIGTVKDITWRHTIIRERSGNEIWIPNSVLNSTQLEKLPSANAAFTTIPFTMRGDTDVSMASKRILELVGRATANISLKKTNPSVRFTGFTPYGICGEVVLYAAHGVSFAQISDAASRAIAGENYIVQNGNEQAQPGPAPVEDNQETVTLQPLSSKSSKKGDAFGQGGLGVQDYGPLMPNGGEGVLRKEDGHVTAGGEEANGNPYVNRILKKLVSITETKEKERPAEHGNPSGLADTNPEVARQIGVKANPERVEVVPTEEFRVRLRPHRHSPDGSGQRKTGDSHGKGREITGREGRN